MVDTYDDKFDTVDVNKTSLPYKIVKVLKFLQAKIFVLAGIYSNTN